MRALLATYGSRRDVKQIVGLADQMGTLAREGEKCGASAETGRMATGVRR